MIKNGNITLTKLMMIMSVLIKSRLSSLEILFELNIAEEGSAQLWISTILTWQRSGIRERLDDANEKVLTRLSKRTPAEEISIYTAEHEPGIGVGVLEQV